MPMSPKYFFLVFFVFYCRNFALGFDLIGNKLNPKTNFHNTFFKHFFNQKGVLRNEGLSSNAVLLNGMPLSATPLSYLAHFYVTSIHSHMVPNTPRRSQVKQLYL